MLHRFLLGGLKLAHGVLYGRSLGEIVCVYFEEHLLDVRYAYGVHRGLALVRHLELELEEAVQLLPQLQGLLPRDLLQDEAHAVRKRA